MNLRNKPVDRRRLNAQDREAYRSRSRQSAHAKAKQRRGNWAWNEHSEKRTQEARPGSGGFTLGRSAQQQRLRNEGAEIARSKQLRNEGALYINDPR